MPPERANATKAKPINVGWTHGEHYCLQLGVDSEKLAINEDPQPNSIPKLEIFWDNADATDTQKGPCKLIQHTFFLDKD